MHACIESNENLNIYRGNVVLNGNGAATIRLPHWMQDLNEDFSYQLTPIGGAAQLYISKEMQNNSFAIAGGKPGMKVSWVVTGARKDAYIKAHPLIVEQEKLGADKGKFINPELFGAGPEQAIGYQTAPAVEEQPAIQASPTEPVESIEDAEATNN